MSINCAALAKTLVLALVLLPASVAEAGNQDLGFLKGGVAARIRDYLQERGCRAIGILNFEVKVGKNAPNMNVGKLNALVAMRLENALIFLMDPKSPIGITRNAGADVKGRKATWHNDEGRAKLFEHQYPLAWGNKSVAVDAFLAGTVEISEDFREMKIAVKLFDKKNTALRVVGKPISVKTDREVLREMGISYVISKRAFDRVSKKVNVPDSELDAAAVDQVAFDSGKGRKGGLENFREYLDLKILVDNVAATIKNDDPGLYTFDAPSPEQKVIINVTAKEKLGLLLTVDGINTVNKKAGEHQSALWVLEPGKEIQFRGFYKDGLVYPFQLAKKTETDDTNLSPDLNRQGVISLDIFNPIEGSELADNGVARIVIVPRLTRSLITFTGRNTTLRSLHQEITKSLHSPTRPRITTFPLPSVPNLELAAVLIGGIDIHFRPK